LRRPATLRPSRGRGSAAGGRGRCLVYLYLDGSTPIEARRKAVAAFQAGKADVFLISLKAGGTGLNLTAADYVIHLDPWWNPAVEDQASDRAHRIGQDKPVTVYRLVMRDSIEERILAVHARKRELADAILEGTDTVAPLSLEELRGLLEAPASDGGSRASVRLALG
jgi:SNF2 family DNA or RNA helicase